jgi:hypothetical protein
MAVCHLPVASDNWLRNTDVGEETWVGVYYSRDADTKCYKKCNTNER